jgi:hypothetical protein
MNERRNLISSDEGLYYLLATLNPRAFGEYKDSLDPRNPLQKIASKVAEQMTLPARIEAEKEKDGEI